MKILLIGTGRVAFNLGHAMAKAGLELIGVMGRNSDRTKQLAAQLKASPFSFNDPLPPADVVLIAVSDDAIATVSDRIGGSNAVVIHTSGASSIDLLSPHPQRGVLWPVQTFISEKVIDLQNVPLIIEGNTDQVRSMVLQLARKLSDTVIGLDHVRRQRLHLAAVLTANFPVALVMEAQDLLEAQGLSKELLMPLWKTTAANVIEMGVQKALTGPAKRGDRRTIENQIALLHSDPQLQQVYRSISELILGKGSH